MDNNEFIDFCKQVIINFNKEINNISLNEKDVHIVWLCKTLQNNKALVSTNVKGLKYYELIYNGDKKEMYVDAYVKQDNFVVIEGQYDRHKNN